MRIKEPYSMSTLLNESPPLLLYSTDGCSLCDDLIEWLDNRGISYHYIDIATDPKLIAEFGWYIPVLRYNATLWKSPIDRESLLQELIALGLTIAND